MRQTPEGASHLGFTGWKRDSLKLTTSSTQHGMLPAKRLSCRIYGEAIRCCGLVGRPVRVVG
eukprot:3066519-Amphidinium_carterae.2